MNDISEAFALAYGLIASWNADLVEIVALSLQVSVTAVVIASVLGFCLGAVLAAVRFPGRGLVIALVNTAMGLPPVVVGLVVYLMLSRAGPLGVLGLLYTPTAMIIAQVILITPIVAALAHQYLANLNSEYDEFFRSLGLSGLARAGTLLRDGRYGLVGIGLAGFARAISEVGAVMIVGGNINHATRIMTTAIALETSRGTLAMALALGIILLALSFVVNAGVLVFRRRAGGRRFA